MSLIWINGNTTAPTAFREPLVQFKQEPFGARQVKRSLRFYQILRMGCLFKLWRGSRYQPSGRTNLKEKGTEKPKMAGNKEKRSLPSFDAPFDASMFTEKSGTIWTDSHVTSFTLEGAFQVTKEVWVDQVEYLADIPCAWPIPKIQTATRSWQTDISQACN